jgi:NHLM bacteriocin system secretion protein
MPQGNELFRQEALERLSSPEKLDQLLKVVNPKAWLPLATTGSLVVVAVGWSIFGRIPLTVAGQGVLIQPRRVVQFQAPSEGQIVKLNFQPGDRVKKGDILGTISQDGLEQELELEKQKLAELLNQNRDSSELQKKRIRLELQSLGQRRVNLEESLRRAEIERDLRDKSLELLAQNRANLENSLRDFQGLVPELRQKSLNSLTQNRESLKERLQQIKQLLPVLEERIESHRRLLAEQLITGDVLLAAEREYFSSLAQLSELETQLKQLDVEETNTQGQYLQNLNQIGELKGRLQQTDVEEANVQRQYLQSLNQIDEIKSNIEQIKSQEAKLAQEDLETSFDKNNRILEVRNRIAQLERELTGKSQIKSEYNGKVLEVAAVPGQLIGAGNRLGSIAAEEPNSQLVGVAYFADKDGKQIKPGMQVQVTPSIVKRERYGGIVGEVTQVSSFPVTPQNMAAIIGNENLAQNLADNITRSGGQAPVQVFAKLQTDPNTFSEYKWSSSQGPSLKISSGTTTQVRVTVGKIAPISYVIPLFRSLTGIY